MKKCKTKKENFNTDLCKNEIVPFVFAIIVGITVVTIFLIIWRT